MIGVLPANVNCLITLRRTPGYCSLPAVCCIVVKKAIIIAKKRANGKGNIRKRKDGRWEGRYTAGYDSTTGKRLIPRNPCGDSVVPKPRKLEIKILPPEHMKAYLNAAEARGLLPMF